MEVIPETGLEEINGDLREADLSLLRWLGRTEFLDRNDCERAFGWKAKTIHESEVALISECRSQCAQTVLDIADIVRDGDFLPTTISPNLRLANHPGVWPFCRHPSSRRTTASASAKVFCLVCVAEANKASYKRSSFTIRPLELGTRSLRRHTILLSQQFSLSKLIFVIYQVFSSVPRIVPTQTWKHI